MKKNNKLITKCEICDIKLTNEKYVKYYDDNGNLIFNNWTVGLNDIIIRKFIIYELNKLKDIVLDFNVKKIILDGYIEVVDKKNVDDNKGEITEVELEDKKSILNHIIFRLVIDGQKYNFLDFIVSKVNYLPQSDTSYDGYYYDSFYYNYFEYFNEMISKTFEYSLKNMLNINAKIERKLTNLALNYKEG